MQHRINWEYNPQKNYFNFRWKYSTKNINYSQLSANNSVTTNERFQVK